MVLLQVLRRRRIAAIVGLFPVRIPGAKTAVAGAEIFIFLMLLLYGAPAAVLAAALEGFVASYRASKRWTSRIVTPAMASLAMLACGRCSRSRACHIANIGMNSARCSWRSCSSPSSTSSANTLLTSALFALKRDSARSRRFAGCATWAGSASPTSPAPRSPALLYMSFEQFGLPVLLVAVPVIAMFLSTLHSYFQRKESDERHMEELKESESRFHSAFTHAAIGMALVSTEGKFIQANKAFCEMLGRGTPQLLDADLETLVNPDDLAALHGPVDKLVKGELPPCTPSFAACHLDGSDVWMSLNISLARDWQFRRTTSSCRPRT